MGGFGKGPIRVSSVGGSTHIDQFGFDGNLPTGLDFVQSDEVFVAVQQQMHTAEIAGDEDLQRKIYKHKQLTYLALWGIMTESNTNKPGYKDPHYGVITEYGCWCLPSQYNNFTAGHGEPIDAIDSACHDRNRCSRCAVGEFEDCSATTGYSFEAVENMDGSRVIKCTDPEGSCGRSLCECDSAFVNTLSTFYPDWNAENSFYRYDGSSKFDRKTKCHVAGQPLPAAPVVVAPEPVEIAIAPKPVSPIKKETNNVFDYFTFDSDADNTESDDGYGTYESALYGQYDGDYSNYYEDQGLVNDDDEDDVPAAPVAAAQVQPAVVPAAPAPAAPAPSPVKPASPVVQAVVQAEPEEQNTASLFDYFDTPEVDASDIAYDDNVKFNHLTGKWEIIPENDAIYDHYTWDDIEEHPDLEWVKDSYRYFTDEQISAMPSLRMNTNEGEDGHGLGLDSAIEAVKIVAGNDWRGGFINPDTGFVDIDHSDYDQVNSAYNSVDYDGNVFDHNSNLLENPTETCCGVYPRRFPYVASTNKQCCKYGTFNPLTHSCCDERITSGQC